MLRHRWVQNSAALAAAIRRAELPQLLEVPTPNELLRAVGALAAPNYDICSESHMTNRHFTAWIVRAQLWNQ